MSGIVTFRTKESVLVVLAVIWRGLERKLVKSLALLVHRNVMQGDKKFASSLQVWLMRMEDPIGVLGAVEFKSSNALVEFEDFARFILVHQSLLSSFFASLSLFNRGSFFFWTEQIFDRLTLHF